MKEIIFPCTPDGNCCINVGLKEIQRDCNCICHTKIEDK